MEDEFLAAYEAEKINYHTNFHGVEERISKNFNPP